MSLEAVQSKLLKGWSNVRTLFTTKKGGSTRFAILVLITSVVFFLDAETRFRIEISKSSLGKLLDNADKTLRVIPRKFEPLVEVVLNTI